MTHSSHHVHLVSGVHYSYISYYYLHTHTQYERLYISFYFLKWHKNMHEIYKLSPSLCLSRLFWLFSVFILCRCLFYLCSLWTINSQTTTISLIRSFGRSSPTIDLFLFTFISLYRSLTHLRSLHHHVHMCRFSSTCIHCLLRCVIFLPMIRCAANDCAWFLFNFFPRKLISSSESLATCIMKR